MLGAKLLPMNACLIVNPAAGSVNGAESLDALRAACDRRGIRIEATTETRGAEAIACEVAEQGVGTVIAAGGDGTVSEVVNGLASHLESVRLAIVPLGTANDFAATLGLPSGDPEAALAALDGEERWVDLIHTSANGGRLIINAATGGFSEVVHGKLTPELKQAWGPLAYLRAAVDAVPEICFHSARVVIDGQPLLADTCALVVANGRSAGGMTLAPAAKVDDARIDVLLITAQAFLEQMRLAAQYVAGTHLESQHVVFRRARQVRVETDPPMHFSSDGELIGKSPIEFRVAPSALRVLTPPPAVSAAPTP